MVPIDVCDNLVIMSFGLAVINNSLAIHMLKQFSDL